MNPKSSVLMMPFSTVYRAVTEARLAAYRSGLFRVSTLDAPVISIGNITTGGTGKTPLVEWVCRTISDYQSHLKEEVLPGSICVLTRGYGKADPKAQVVVSNGKEVLANEREAGDEPLLLARHLLGIASVISNPNRVAAGEFALQELGARIFVLDDGFQHLRLARDLDLVVLDATNPFGGGELLPNGRLRESTANLSRADCVVITRSDQAHDLVALKESVRQLAGNRPVFISRMETTGFQDLNGDDVDPARVVSRRSGVFCGVGNPDSFVKQVRGTGVEIAFSKAFPDHHNYTALDLEKLANQARSNGADCLITTAKDSVKLTNTSLSLPCFVLDIKIVIDDDTRLATLIRTTVAKTSRQS